MGRSILRAVLGEAPGNDARAPASAGAEELLAQWREQVLRGVLLTCVIALTPAIGLQAFQVYSGVYNAPGGLYLGAGALITLFALLVSPLPYRVRAATLLVIGYVFSAAAIVLEGFSPAQFVAICLLITLCVLFYSRRAAVAMLLAVIVAMAAAAFLFASEIVVPHGRAHVDIRNPLNWLRVGLYTLFPTAAAAVATSYLLDKLRETLQQRERALAELERTQAHLVQAQKLQAIGQLAAGIAHDFNNTLSVITLEAELLKRRAGAATRTQDASAAELARGAESLLAAAERGTQLSRQLLLFGRKNQGERPVIDAGEHVREHARTLRRLLPEEIAIDIAITEEAVPVRVQSGELQQVVLNLGINARDAMPQGGTLRIELATCELLSEHAAALRVPVGRYARLALADTGVGMDEATRVRAFEPFFTTKGMGRGTGLGLTNVWSIAQRAGGTAELSSASGRGTTLAMHLPLADAPIEQALALGSLHPLAHGRQRVLVVEDDIRIRALLVTTFADAGYEVLEASSVDAALALERELTGSIDLLCTDVVMPGRPAAELIAHMQRARPNAAILVCSGYSEDEQIARGITLGQLSHLEKPFTGKALLQAARAALQRRAQEPTERR